MVEDAPSVTVEMRCQTPLRLATESSTFFVTWDSSSDGAAPDWVISTCTIGMSMLGKRVIDIVAEADDAEDGEDGERHHRGNWAADRPGRDVETHWIRLPSRRPRSVSGVGRTRSPGLKKAAERATMLSPSATPPLISTVSPSTMPGVTRRSSTRPSRTT